MCNGHEDDNLGRCASCGDINIVYDGIAQDSSGIYYPYQCPCGHTGKEHYDIVYQGTE